MTAQLASEVLVREHIKIWLRWYDSALDDFLCDLGPADDEEEDGDNDDDCDDKTRSNMVTISSSPRV